MMLDIDRGIDRGLDMDMAMNMDTGMDAAGLDLDLDLDLGLSLNLDLELELELGIPPDLEMSMQQFLDFEGSVGTGGDALDDGMVDSDHQARFQHYGVEDWEGRG